MSRWTVMTNDDAGVFSPPGAKRLGRDLTTTPGYFRPPGQNREYSYNDNVANQNPDGQTCMQIHGEKPKRAKIMKIWQC